MPDDLPSDDDAPAMPDDVDLRVPETATDEEAAAIAAAVGAYLAEERAAAETADRGRSWQGRRWSLAGRLELLTGRPRRVSSGAPASGWNASGRADRF